MLHFHIIVYSNKYKYESSYCFLLNKNVPWRIAVTAIILLHFDFKLIVRECIYY